MARRRRTSATIRRIVVSLIAVSLLLYFLPRQWTAPLTNLVQALVPFLDGAGVALDSAGSLLSDEPATVPAEQFREVQAQRDQSDHRAMVLSARVEELESEVRRLTTTRFWQAGSPALGMQGRLIPARVLVGDLLAWRDSHLVTAGWLQGARAGDAVTSATIAVERGDDAGLVSGLAILYGEVLVGWVEQVATHTSRVRLVSDPEVQMKVRIGRWDEQGFQGPDRYFWLKGRGKGRLEIADLDRRMIEGGEVAVGDAVLSDAENPALPVSMVIGSIAQIGPDLDHPLLSTAVVEPGVRVSELRRVYVYDARLEEP